MREINVRLSGKAGAFLAALICIVFAALIANLYVDHKNTKKDLYGLRNDYYGDATEYPGGEKGSEAAQLGLEIVAQNTKSARVLDADNANYKQDDASTHYVQKSVRELEVKVKNNFDYLYSFYSSIGAKTDNGVIVRAVNVHADDNQTPDQYKQGFDLAPGGEATIFVYFLDDGKEITNLTDSSSGGI